MGAGGYLFPLLLIGGVGLYQLYFFFVKKRVTDTPAMRTMYGYQPGETLTAMWPNGLLWHRPVSDRETMIRRIGNVVGLFLGFELHSVYQPLVLSLTTSGVFILNDKQKQGNIGTIRFRHDDIQTLTRLDEPRYLAAAGVGQMEGASDVELTLRNGSVYRFQLPDSAYQALTNPVLPNSHSQ